MSEFPPIPAPGHGVTVYGREGCWYSHAASQVPGVKYYQLNQYYSDPREFLYHAREFIGNHRTFPVVFINGKFIGGYNELTGRLASEQKVTVR